AAHPVPDARAVAAGAELVGLLSGGSAEDLVIVLLSGGASALLELPAEGLDLRALQRTNELLLGAGAPIHDVNAVRKHLSRIKGGGLARAAFPARVLVLVLSDVLGNALDTIGSGPTAPDPTTFGDAIGVLQRYGIWDTAPAAVRAHLLAGEQGKRPETAKPGDPVFERVQHVIIGSIVPAAEAAVADARARGLNALLLSTHAQGQAREVGPPLPPPAPRRAGHGRP